MTRFTPNPFRVTRKPDEGRDADPNALGILRGLVDSLEGEQRAQVIQWAKDADAAGAPFRPSQNPSLRRFELSRASWRAVTSSLLPDDTMRTALAVVLGDDEVQGSFPTGALLGSLGWQEAERLAHVLDLMAFPSSETNNQGDTAA